jgi:hypothetical protein
MTVRTDLTAFVFLFLFFQFLSKIGELSCFVLFVFFLKKKIIIKKAKNKNINIDLEDQYFYVHIKIGKLHLLRTEGCNELYTKEIYTT